MVTSGLRKARGQWRAAKRNRELRRLGLVEFAPHYAILPRIGRGEVALDIGVGDDPQFSKYLIEQFGVQSYGVDPTHKHAPGLREVERTTPGFRYLPYALGAVSGQATFFESVENVSGSVFAGHRNVTHGESVPYEVEVLSLPDLFARIGISRAGVVKIDAEGVEYEVLQSLDTSFLRQIGQLIVEFHHNCIDGFTREDTLTVVDRLGSAGMKRLDYNDHDWLFFW